MRIDTLTKLMDRPAIVEPLPITARYAQDALRWEIIKSGGGALLCVGLLVGLQPTPWIGWPLVGIAGLFTAYLVQQVRRVPVRYQVDEAGVRRSRGATHVTLRWEQLTSLRLNFYANGRKANSGTLVLILRDASQRFKVDSNLDHFPTLLVRAAQAARAQGFELHPTTQANLERLEL